MAHGAWHMAHGTRHMAHGTGLEGMRHPVRQGARGEAKSDIYYLHHLVDLDDEG